MSASIRHRLDPASRALLRGAASVLSPPGARARLLILIYHRVLPERHAMLPDVCDRNTFDWHMSTLRQLFNVLPLGEATARLRDRSLPRRAACVTFDDGYADNVQNALPILQQHRIPATFFVASGYLDGGCMFNDIVFDVVGSLPDGAHAFPEFGLPPQQLDGSASRRAVADAVIGRIKYLPHAEREQRALALAERVGVEVRRDLMMTAADISRLAGSGMEIGGHTVDHPILTGMSHHAALREILAGRERLRELSGQEVRCFAYPNGKPGRDYQRSHVEAVREAGFDAAVSTAWGAANVRVDPLQIPRVAPWDSTPRRWAARLLKAYLDTPAERV